MRNLRDSLESYYATDGINDPIRIQFLKGSGCRATVAYTHRSPADVSYRRGLQNLRSFNPQDVHNAVAHFEEAIAADPDYAAAYARLAEAMCNLSWYVYDRPPRDILLAAHKIAERGIALAPDAWESLLGFGIVSLCLHRWEEGAKAFEAALALDETRTSSHLWFCQYLDVTGRFPGTVAKTERDFLNAPDDEYRAYTHAYSLYFARRFDEAEKLCREILRLDRFSFRGHGGMYLTCVSAGKPEQALFHAQQLHALAQADIFSGLISLAYARLGETEKARSILTSMLQQTHTGYVTKF